MSKVIENIQEEYKVKYPKALQIFVDLTEELGNKVNKILTLQIINKKGWDIFIWDGEKLILEMSHPENGVLNRVTLKDKSYKEVISGTFNKHINKLPVYNLAFTASNKGLMKVGAAGRWNRGERQKGVFRQPGPYLF